MDEIEEWSLITGHYCIAWAAKDAGALGLAEIAL